MMKMYFHGGTMEVVLFDFWRVRSDAGMAYSCLGIIVLAFLYEGLKFFRDSLYASTALREAAAVSSQNNSRTHLDVKMYNRQSWRSSMLRPMHLVQTFLHALQFLVSYLLMLVFMTYNSWLCLAVVLGAALGYFVFGWKKHSAVEITEHCH